MTPMRCRIVRAAPIGGRARAHRASCLRCQATDARHRVLHRELEAIGRETVPAPRQLAPAVATRLGTQDAVDPRRALAARLTARYAAAAGVSAATAAALITGIVRRRSRVPG